MAVMIAASTVYRACDPPQAITQYNTIPYPKPLPDTTAIPFLPGLVCSDSMDFGSAFSPDGRSFYFTRSINKKTIIYVSHYKGAEWQAPVPFPPVGSGYSEADPAFAPDGKIYFISNRPKNTADTIKDFDIWFAAPAGNGGWSGPERVETINTDSNEYYISFAKNGNLYFASSRAGGYGEEDVYVSRLVNQQYASPENLGPAINTSKSEYDPGISREEDMLVFASSNREGGFGAADLYASKINEKRQWQPAANLGRGINTPTRDFCPYFSPDGKYFFFSTERDIKWVRNDFVKRQ